MSLAAGTRLGPYEIVAAIGAGGMGEVYAARDTRLARRVAIKVLAPALAEDPEFRTRFAREARTISSLTHPNICALYDVGEDPSSSGGADHPISYLVLEYVEGEPLAARLHRGPVPLPQLLAIGTQLADALAAAHRAGIVHRDIKPGNVVLTKTGAKLLDFGIAKPHLGMTPAQTMASTVSSPITSRGSPIGTPNYMAPEQLEGREADARSDIFALGAVIHELATGRRAFGGKTQAGVIASILTYDPPPISHLQPLAPPALDRVVRKCLEKDPDLRWQSAADLASELKWVEEGHVDRAQSGPAVARSSLQRAALWWLPAVVGALFLVASWTIVRSTPHAPAVAPVRTFIPAPRDITFAFLGDQGGAMAVTRDGRALVVVGYQGGRRMLFLRPLDDTAIRPVPGTEDATFPFWSPDGKSIGFFANGQLKRVDVAGGQVIALAPVGDARGGTWGDGFILYAPKIRDGIYRVSAEGGQPVQLTRLDRKLHTTHRWPVVLPDNQHFLFFAGNHNASARQETGIYAASMNGGATKFLVMTDSDAMYVPGYLLYTRAHTLVAQPFDVRQLALSGDAAPVTDVAIDSTTWKTVAAASDSGLLAYETGVTGGTVLTWYDRSGRTLSSVGDAVDVMSERASPDGSRVAVVRSTGAPEPDIWIYDVRTNHERRLTFGPGVDFRTVVWSPEGDRIAYASRRDPPGQGLLQIYVKRADGSGGEDLFFKGDQSAEPTDWSPDGRYLIFNRGEGGQQSIWAMPVVGDRRPFPVLTANYDQCDARLSPDGRSIAYTSSETGTDEIFVTRFPNAAGKWQVSNGGGELAQWRADGKELFFLTADSQIAAVSVESFGTTLDIGPVRKLFRAPLLAVRSQWASYAIMPDGQRFAVPAVLENQSPPITVWTNWTSALAR